MTTLAPRDPGALAAFFNSLLHAGDGWTAITKDRKLSAQWEHTILVTADGYEIFTLRADDTIARTSA